MGGSDQRINASQAHRLTGSQAHRLTGSHHDEICEWLSLALLCSSFVSQALSFYHPAVSQQSERQNAELPAVSLFFSYRILLTESLSYLIVGRNCV